MFTAKIAETLGYITLGGIFAVPFLLLNLRFASTLGFIDWPKSRGISLNQVPIIGYGMVGFVWLIMAVATYLYDFSTWILITSGLIALMGHLDDRRPLPALEKLVWQLICVTVVLYFDPNIRGSIGEEYGTIGYFAAGLFVVGLVNAINFIDGIDGLAGTILFVGALGLTLLAFNLGSHYPYGLVSSVSAGVMVPFLYFNIFKRNGFLGNVGSYFFGYVLATSHLSIPMQSSDFIARLGINALCFLVPIADSVTVITSRLITMRSPFQGDKGHLHHRLLQSSLSLRSILFNFGLIAMTGIVIAFLFNEKSAMQHSRLPFVICLAYIAIVALLIGMIERSSKRRLKSYFMRFDAGEPVYFLKYKIRLVDGRPLPPTLLRRIEAKISTEIRVYDTCFSHGQDELFVILNSMGEPIRAITERLDPVFQSERVQASLVIDQGEYVKRSHLKQTGESGRGERESIQLKA